MYLRQGELLPKKPELLVYNRRRLQMKSINPFISPMKSQSHDPKEGLEKTQVNSKLDSTSSSIEPLNFCIYDSYIPILSLTNHPNAKYLLHKKLSNNHKAFLSEKFDPFAPRTNQEALSDEDIGCLNFEK